MAEDRIHCVLVGTDRGWEAVSDRDLLRAAEIDMDKVSAGEVVGELHTITVDEPLERARRMMVDENVAHLLVLDSRLGRPLGVLSTLDIAAILA
jgi:CBS domain-containing protein